MPKQNSRRSHGIRGRLTAKTLPPLLACAWLLPGCDDSGPDAAPQESAQTASANPNANTNATDDDNPAGGRSNPAVSKLIGELRPEGLVSDPLPPAKSPGAAPRSVDTDPPPAAEPDTEEFLLGLGAGLSELVETLVVRLERMDADVVLARGSEGLEWTWRGREQCRVLAREGLLEGWLADREPRPIGSEQDLERFVEAALVRWVQLTEELEGLGEVELVPAGPRPLLSAEELDLLSN